MGRWPANILHDGSDEVLAVFPESAGQLADESRSAPSEKTSGIYGRMRRTGEQSAQDENDGDVGFKMRPGMRRLDSGSAARFFWSPKASTAERNLGLGPNDQNRHPTVKPVELMSYLCRLVCPPGGVILDPFMGSGSTGIAASREGFGFIGLDLDDEHCRIARLRITGDAPLFTQEVA